MKKKISSLVALPLLLSLFACSNNNTQTTTQPSVAPKTYTVKVYDIDDEVIGDYKYNVNNETLFDALKNDPKCEIEYSESQYGAYVTSINSSIIDSNYALMIYINNESAQKGISEIKPKADDVIEIKNECWNYNPSDILSLDDSDILVDKLIYKYAKTYLIEDIKDDTVEDFNNNNFNNFNTYIALNMLKENGYTIDAKALNNDIYQVVKNYDLSTITEMTTYGKYYYYAKAFDINLDNYASIFKAYTDSNDFPSVFGENSEWSLPFVISPLLKYNSNSSKINTLKNSNYTPSVEWLYDGANWFYTANALFGKDAPLSYLEEISQADYDNPTSLALSIGTFSSYNVLLKADRYKKDNKTLVDRLLEYCDNNKLIIRISEDKDIDFSTNQIYSALMSYKFSRDNSTRINYFN